VPRQTICFPGVDEINDDGADRIFSTVVVEGRRPAPAVAHPELYVLS